MPLSLELLPSSSRWTIIYMQALWWRACMSLGMYLHRLARPRPRPPSFRVKIPVTLSAAGHDETIELVFYVPRGYPPHPEPFILKHGGVRPSGNGGRAGDASSTRATTTPTTTPTTTTTPAGARYPVLINFHGGGWTLGAATDDARWADAVVDRVGAVVVSVAYRLAPERPFPAAVEDGVDAVLWLHRHADALNLDRDRLALSGFSAGGNLCFTVPLRLRDELKRRRAGIALGGEGFVEQPGRMIKHRKTGDGALEEQDMYDDDDDDDDGCGGHVRLRAIVPWYPSVDSSRTRDQRRRSNPGGAHRSLHPVFTSLFDAAYLPAPSPSPPASARSRSKSRSDTSSKKRDVYSNPYLSPACASDQDLIEALPDHIILNTCEWDMLLVEAEDFRERLRALPSAGDGSNVHDDDDDDDDGHLNPRSSFPTSPTTTTTTTITTSERKKKKKKTKDVRGKVIPKVEHAWDKSPTFLFSDPGRRRMTMVMACYDEACRDLQRVL